jgi:hypothetical protein
MKNERKIGAQISRLRFVAAIERDFNGPFPN